MEIYRTAEIKGSIMTIMQNCSIVPHQILKLDLRTNQLLFLNCTFPQTNEYRLQLPKGIALTISNATISPCMLSHITCNLTTLIKLNLGDNMINDEGVAALHLQRFRKLEVLDLSGNQITAEGAKHLRNIRIVELKLFHNKLGDQGAKWLAMIGNSLKVLMLSHNQITDEGAMQLVKLRSLETLMLGWNKISLIGFMALMALRNLNKINIYYNQIPTQSRNRIRKLKSKGRKAIQLI